MDDKDRLMLTLLRRDARRSTVALARELGLSRSATQERLAKLQASGAIAGFTIVEGRGTAAPQSAYLSVTFEPGRKCAEIVPKLKKLAHLGAIHALTGPVDLMIRADGDTVADLELARAAVAAVPGVKSVSTAIVLERHLG